MLKFVENSYTKKIVKTWHVSVCEFSFDLSHIFKYFQVSSCYLFTHVCVKVWRKENENALFAQLNFYTVERPEIHMISISIRIPFGRTIILQHYFFFLSNQTISSI